MLKKNFYIINNHFSNIFGVFSLYLYVAVIRANFNSTAELIGIVFFKKTQHFYFQFLSWHSVRLTHLGPLNENQSPFVVVRLSLFFSGIFWDTGVTYVMMKSSIVIQTDWVRWLIMLENRLVIQLQNQVKSFVF